MANSRVLSFFILISIHLTSSILPVRMFNIGISTSAPSVLAGLGHRLAHHEAIARALQNRPVTVKQMK
jgi:hypothetical protein